MQARILLFILSLCFTQSLQAQLAEFKVGQRERLMHFSIPVILTGNEFAGHLEFNLGGVASVAFEYIYIPEVEQYSDKTIKEENRSLLSKGQEFAVHMSRYTREAEMGGFYYSLGAGYRIYDIALSEAPDADYTLAQDQTLDEDGRLMHKLQGTGGTAHGRLGYRYVGERWPVVVGGFFGIRHFEGKFEDRKGSNSATTSTEQRDQLARYFMTRPELAVEMGFSF